MSTAAQPVFTPEFVTHYRDMLCDSLERERATTLRVLRAVPKDKLDYKPDPKSRTAGELARHVAYSGVWFLDSIADLSFNTTAYDDSKAPTEPAAIADWYEKETKRALARVRAMKPEKLGVSLDFYGAFNMAAFCYLDFEQKHQVHHRAQLSVYLRPMGSKVPDIYGGSADEPWEG